MRVTQAHQSASRIGPGARLLRLVRYFTSKRTPELSRWRSSSERKLGCLQVCRSGLTTTPIGLHIERKLLTLVKIMHASPLDRRNVNEHIRATVVLNDEAVTLLGIEKFNCTCGHNGLLIKRAKASLPIQTIRMGSHIRDFACLGEGR